MENKIINSIKFAEIYNPEQVILNLILEWLVVVDLKM